MASLALIVSMIVLSVLLMGPATYILTRLGLPDLLIYILSLSCLFVGLWFCTIGLPIWYMGLIPIYFGYLSVRYSKNRSETKLKKQELTSR